MSVPVLRVSDVHFLVDFDGTVVPGDVTDHVMASFADARWLELEEAFQAGRINSRECMAAQVDLIRATPADLARAVAERDVDPDFPRFVDMCAAHGISVTIVSDGFDLSIALMLKRYGLSLPYVANHLEYLGAKRWRLGFPHRNATCRMSAANCKCLQVPAVPKRTIMIGDGRSDFCVASRADFVLSKGRLSEHCHAQKLSHAPITGFGDVVARFDHWLAEARADLPNPDRLSIPARRSTQLAGNLQDQLQQEKTALSG
jgi:2-hydroxy-3-keto-5-methylthiopentenyl-1-phosphate phosphatase